MCLTMPFKFRSLNFEGSVGRERNFGVFHLADDIDPAGVDEGVHKVDRKEPPFGSEDIVTIG